MPNFRFPTGATREPEIRYAGGGHGRPQRSPIPLQTVARLGLAGLAAAAAIIGSTWLYRSDTLRVKQIQVVGAQIVDPNAAAARAAIANESLLRLDTQAAAKRVAELPGVASARVHRDWPHSAVIDITERQGWGYWQILGVRSVIDAEGRAVEQARPPASDAPTVYEVGAATPLPSGGAVDRDTVALVDRLLHDGTFEQLRQKPARFEFERRRGLIIRPETGPSAVFGDSHDYEFKVAAWTALMARIRAGQLTASEIDLRFGKELVVR